MFSKVPSVAIFSCVTLVLAGCTLLPIKKIQPLIAPPSASACPNETRVQLLVNGTNRFGYPLTKNIPQFGYLLPADNDPASGRGVTQRSSLKTFVDYDRAVGMRLRDKLDSDLVNDSVVKAFTAFVTSVSGEAQLDAQIADGTAASSGVDVQEEFTAIRQRMAPPKLQHRQLKAFANKLYEIQLKHTAADYTKSGPNPSVVADATAAKSNLTQTLTMTRPKFDDALVAYLKAYYNGNFYDRLGTSISKPQLPDLSNLVSSLSNFSLPDSEIVAAETVLLEFLVDNIDPTPVMGNTTCPIPTTNANSSCQPNADDPTTTTYYPGNSSNQPTALTVGLAKYVELPATGCGITTQNVWVLQTLANGASDEAGTVSGLIANSAGGLGVSLGVFGKISIGDNATLSDLVKTAASDLALRATLLASYFSLYHLDLTGAEIFQPPAVPALVPSPTSLTFAYTVGAATPVSQTVAITNPSKTNSNLGWTASSNAAWLTFATGTAGTPGSVNITATPGILSPQTYSGKITLTPTSGTAPSVSIPVTFTVSAP